MTSSDIVITGMGAIGCFGGSVDDFWNAVNADAPCLSPSARLPGLGVSANVGDWFDLNAFKRSGRGKRAPLISQFALAAASQAISSAGLDKRGQIPRDDISIVYGTGNGPNEVVERNLSAITADGLTAVEPLSFQESVFNAPASLISIEYGFRGPLHALPMGWAAGGYAIATAADLIRFGHAETVIVVVSDEMSAIGNTAMRGLRLISDRAEASDLLRPYSLEASGASNGEGAAAIVLETREAAACRDAQPLAVLGGWSMTSDSHGVGPKRNSVGIHAAMSLALDQIPRQAPDVIFAGSYMTRDADIAEAQAIKALFPAGAAPNRPVTTNLRGTIGEAKAATGLFNVIAAIRAIQTGQVPGTRGTEPRGPDCDIALVPVGGTRTKVGTALCNAFWVNGTNSAVCVLAAEGI